MRLWIRHHFGVVGLAFFLMLFTGACSSSQQEAENLEATEQGDQDQQEDENEDQEEANENGEGNFNTENMANEEMMNNMGDENLAEGGNEAENDLQEIISEMDNGENANMNADANMNAGADANMNANANMNAAPVENAVAQENAQPEMTTTSEGGVITGMAGASAAPGLPEMGSKMPYIVQAGDSLGKISSKVYGTPGRWRDIATLSGIDNPNHIYPGDIVYFQLTQESLAFAQAYENVTRQEIVVQAGDTLATISKRAYGSSRHWKSIWRQNDRIMNPDRLNVGATVFYVSEAALSAEVQNVKSELNDLAFQDIQLEEATQIDDSGFEFAEIDMTPYGSSNVSNLTTLLSNVING